MAERKVKVGIVGLGHMAQDAHIPSLISIEDATIAAICDNNEEILEKVGRKYNVESLYTSYVEMAEKSDCDCVFVLTKPDSLHPVITNVMLKNGKDVMCEKAMATRLSEARGMVEIAERASRILMIGFNRRFMPICEKAKATVHEIDVCKITLNVIGSTPGVNVLLEAPHAVDLLRHFCGEVKSLHCSCKKNNSASEVSITSLMEFESGAAGVMIFNNRSGGYSENVELHGIGYSAIVDMVTQTTRMKTSIHSSGGTLNPEELTEYTPPKWPGLLMTNGFLLEDRHFIECVRNRKQPLTNGADAYKSHELVNRISHASGLPTLE